MSPSETTDGSPRSRPRECMPGSAPHDDTLASRPPVRTRVLVTGATGFVGGRLVSALLERGHEVVALVRDAEKYTESNGVTVVEGDLLEPESLGAAFVVDEGKRGTIGPRHDDRDGPAVDATVDAAYYLVHSMDGGPGYEERDRQCARNFTDAASAAGVQRVVYLGGLGEDREELSDHLRSRREVERLLAEGTFALTTLRAAIIIGAGSASFEVIRDLSSRLPVMITPKWVDTRCQPIAIDDVVEYLIGVLETPDTAGETYEIGGPEVLTYADVLRRTRRQLGRGLRIVRVPVLSPKLSALWLRLVTDVNPSLARSLVEGLKNTVVVDDDRLREHIPIDATPFDLSVARALFEARGGVSNDRSPVSTNAEAVVENQPVDQAGSESEVGTRFEFPGGTGDEVSPR